MSRQSVGTTGLRAVCPTTAMRRSPTSWASTTSTSPTRSVSGGSSCAARTCANSSIGTIWAVPCGPRRRRFRRRRRAAGPHQPACGVRHQHRQGPYLQHAARLVHATSPEPEQDWDSPAARYTPTSDDIPWCRAPENKVTVEDIDFLMSSHFEGTPFDPYGTLGTPESRHRYRPIGINRTGHMVAIELRHDVPAAAAVVMWIAFGSGPFTAVAPFMRTWTTLRRICATPRPRSPPTTCTGRTV